METIMEASPQQLGTLNPKPFICHQLPDGMFWIVEMIPGVSEMQAWSKHGCYDDFGSSGVGLNVIFFHFVTVSCYVILMKP